MAAIEKLQAEKPLSGDAHQQTGKPAVLCVRLNVG
jgi:hypothetical protein